jgi:hypothetical protein
MWFIFCVQPESALQEAQHEPATILAETPETAAHVARPHDERWAGAGWRRRAGPGRRRAPHARRSRWPRRGRLGAGHRPGRSHAGESRQPQVRLLVI